MVGAVTVAGVAAHTHGTGSGYKAGRMQMDWYQASRISLSGEQHGVTGCCREEQLSTAIQLCKRALTPEFFLNFILPI